MNWNNLDNIDQLEEIDRLSNAQPVLIFKHSTRCSISNTAKSRFEKHYLPEVNGPFESYYLDLLNHRDISNAIASRYGVEHQSPQTLLIKNGKCVHSSTHFEIDYLEIKEIA